MSKRSDITSRERRDASTLSQQTRLLKLPERCTVLYHHLLSTKSRMRSHMMNLNKKKAWCFWILATATTIEGADRRFLLKTLDEELLDHAQEKIDLHAALGHNHPSMTNSLLRSKEMDDILGEGDFRAVGGSRGDSSGDSKNYKKASKAPKGQTSNPTAAPAIDKLPPKGSSKKSTREPKTIGSETVAPKVSKGKKEDSEDTENNEEDSPEKEEEGAGSLPDQEGVESGDGGKDESGGKGGNSTAVNSTQVDQAEFFSGKCLMI